MSVATPMYELPKQVKMPRAVELPGCMYTMEPLNRFSSKDLAPSYYGSTCASAALIQGSSADVAALEVRQETVLQRLRDLKLQLDKLQSSKFSSLSPSKSNSTAIGAAAQSSPLKTGTVHDLVISANPSRPPYFLALLRKLLKDAGYPVYSVDHLHSSVHHVDDSVRGYFSDKPLGDRNKHNLAFTVHWKEVEAPNLMVNPLRQTVISGEANITRYISRLFPLSSPYNYEATGTFSSIAETDNLLDQLASQAASKNNKERQGALRQLNGRLGKTSWLVNNECGIADVFLWSVLKQGGLNVGAPANVDKWYKKVDAMAKLEINTLNSQNDTQSKSSSQSVTPVQTMKKSDNKNSLTSCKTEFVDRNGLEKYLKSLNIPYQVQDHEEVFTVDALMKNVRAMPGLHMKNLFLKDKKKNLYLLSARHNAEVKLSEVGKQLGTKDLRFGDETILYSTLGVKQGCVTAFALLNDRSHQVKFLLDSEAFNDCHPFVNFHPMSNAATLGVAPKDLKKFLNASGHEPTLITFN
ncbi:aminoacyl tRNA synthase complex-interacting multifunctional protein 2-like [Penaeus indicus]|uniref:aminoacyl tRNA synthase complex-interacting multifunctional protein 2-like n=1 Tax=Penaeus indicus TaxID=29960 RepID=UPI00300D530A